MDIYIYLIIGVVAGALVTYLLTYKNRKKAEEDIEATRKEAEKIIRDAKKEAETIIKESRIEAKETILKARADFEKETKEQKKELQALEKRLSQKEENIDRKIDFLSKKDLDIQNKEKELVQKKEELKKAEEHLNELTFECKRRLEKISGMSAEEAKKILIDSIKEEAEHEAMKYVKKIEEGAKDNALKKAKEIIATAIQKTASDYVAETTVSVVDLPSDEMKGRIIGREGRNIRAFEIATGVDLIIDDTPEAVILSAHDPIKREIAKRTLEKLISDGRIHPGKIEEVLGKMTAEVEEDIKEEGNQCCLLLGIHGLHPELVKLLGRLKFRTSYAQNVLEHSKEVAYLCSIMASELGVDKEIAKRAGLLHDIGKAVDHQVEGSHAIIGADIAQKYGEKEVIVNAIRSHHEEANPLSIEAILLQAGDALSAARPGARREMLESYIKRLEKLEELADSFNGVEKSYAIQAGREIRIIVKNEDLSDEETYSLAREIARKIEKELSYPGQIKVTAIRETRAVEYAK
ncbi:MAG: ribonuclease Y [Candidatus Schekmanbacteria bacterium]|nr:MAG: ribonuclease Y [Candidatus Schekmanbacteria bacterium]